MIDWTAIIGLVPDLALVIIFAYYTLETNKRHAESARATMGEWRQYMTEILERQNKVIEQHAAKLAELAAEMRNLALMVERCADHSDARPRRGTNA